ncbi:MAG: hypothetical protein ACOYXC_21070 [Candidatus Rifleibacteriota bacterium]
MKKTPQDGLYAAFDLGSFSIKAAVVEVNNSTPRLAAIEEDNLKAIGDFPSEEEYRVYLIETLQGLASRLPLKNCRKISVLFSNREMQVKIVELPNQVQSDQIEKILTWEAKKLLSPAFRDEPFSYSYRVIKENPYTVALAVIPQRLLEKFIELFELAKIDVDAAYAEVFAAHSLEEAVDQTGLPALSIVNFGHSGTHLQIFSAGELRFYRFIPSGMSEMSQPPKDNELEMYSQKIRFSFDYFRAVSKLSQIDALFFMGGGAASPNILPFERSYFNPARINIVDISSHIDISPVLPDISGNTPAEEKQRRLLPFLPAVGTVLAFFSGSSESMNFALRLKKKKHEKRLEELSKSVPAIMALVGIAFIAALLWYMKGNLNEELLELNKKLELARMNNEAANTKIAKYRAANDTGVKLSPAARKTLAPVLSKQHSMAHILFFLASSCPENLVLSEVLVRNNVEAENISLENLQNQQTSYSEPGDASQPEENVNEFVSRLDSETGGSEQYTEGLGGKILIVRGICPSNAELASFTTGISEKKLCKRLKSVVSKKKSAKQIEFLIKGELP